MRHLLTVVTNTTRHITRLLAADGYNVHCVIRNPDQKGDVEKLGGNPVLQSIEEASVEDMANTITQAKATTVIWSAGTYIRSQTTVCDAV